MDWVINNWVINNWVINNWVINNWVINNWVIRTVGMKRVYTGQCRRGKWYEQNLSGFF